jgi:hypothetical protein
MHPIFFKYSVWEAVLLLSSSGNNFNNLPLCIRLTVIRGSVKYEILHILSNSIQKQVHFQNISFYRKTITIDKVKNKSLQHSILLLKVSLIAQDMALFQQLFALQEAILEFGEELEYCQSSSESSPYDSPCSTLSSLSPSDSDSKWTRVSNIVS